MRQVVDLSNNNAGPFHWSTAKRSLWGVMHKVSEGGSFVDPFWEQRAADARRAGLRVGGYHFAQPGSALSDARVEARHFAHFLGKIQRNDLRPALDLERNSEGLPWSSLERWTREFNHEFEKQTGIIPMLYASLSWLQSMKPDKPIGAGLWLADWSASGKPFLPPVPNPWHKVHLHQYTSKGHVPGIGGQVDLSQALRPLACLAHPVLGLL